MMQNETLEVGGKFWLVRQAKSKSHALSAIDMARCCGSIGHKDMRYNTACGGVFEILADVVQVNSDGTERLPDTAAY